MDFYAIFLSTDFTDYTKLKGNWCQSVAGRMLTEQKLLNPDTPEPVKEIQQAKNQHGRLDQVVEYHY